MPYISSLNQFIKSLDFRYNTQTDVGKTITGKTVVADFGNEYFEFTLTTAPMTRENFYENFMTLLQAPIQSSTLTLPVNKNISTLTGTIKGYNDVVSGGNTTVSTVETTNGVSTTVFQGSTAAGTNQLLIQAYHLPSEGGTTASGILKQGQLLKMGNKIHVVTEEFDVSNIILLDSVGDPTGKVLSTDAVLNIAPATTQDMYGVEIEYDNFEIKCYPLNEVIQTETDIDGLFTFQQDFREVIGDA